MCASLVICIIKVQSLTKVSSLAFVTGLLLRWWQAEQTDLFAVFKDLFQLFVVRRHWFVCQAHPLVALGGKDLLV